jgi:hypothetical protein
MVALKVEGLSSSAANARQIRDAIMAMEPENTEPHLVPIFFDENDYPREALAEALLRFVEEDLASSVR